MKKQKYRFSLTRVRGARIRYNAGLTPEGEYYGTYDYNSTELITQSQIGGNYFKLSDDFLGRAIKVAVFYDGNLQSIDNFYLVTDVTRQFSIDVHSSYIISWDARVFAPTPDAFFQFETKYTHPVFSKLSIDKARSSDNMGYTTVLNSDLAFKAGAFDYIEAITAADALVFEIERYDYSQASYYSIYKSLPFTKAECSLDYDRRQLTVDFTNSSYKAYLDKNLNTTVNIAKGGYRHSSLDFNIPAMLQVYVDGAETITNIVGGSATEVDITYQETPDNFIANVIDNYQQSLQPNNNIFWALIPTAGIIWAELVVWRFYAKIFNLRPEWVKEKWASDYARLLYLSKFGFQLAGRQAEIEIVGGNYREPGSSIIDSPAGFYYATTSDNQISQVYQPTNSIVRFNNDDSNWYLLFNPSTRILTINRKSDNTVVYTSTLPVSTSCLFSPDNISGTQFVNAQDATDRCAVRNHNVFNVFCRILTTKKVEPNIDVQNYASDNAASFTVELGADDFAYTGLAYKYYVYKPVGYSTELYNTVFNGKLQEAHLVRPVSYDMFYVGLRGSTQTQLTDTGLGAKDSHSYYTYKNTQGSNLRQHFIPIGQYFWSGVSFYAALPDNFISVLSPWYYKAEQHHFFTVGAAISKLLQSVAPNIKFAQTSEYSSILYSSQNALLPMQQVLVQKPLIYLTHASNIQAGLFNIEAQKINLSLKKIFDMLRDAFQIYYFVDESGKLHLEHISWFYGINKLDNVQYDTLAVRDAYTKTIIDYGQGKIQADNSYLYSTIKMTADSDDALELFRSLEIKCLEEPCRALDTKEVVLGDFKTDVDYMYASMSERSDNIALLVPTVDIKTGDAHLTYARITRCDIHGLNDHLYNLWPTNYKATSYELLRYYRWNFASKLTDHCSYQVEEREHYFIQEIQIPVDVDIDMEKLISTRFGEGFILSYKLDLDSRYATVKLLHKG